MTKVTELGELDAVILAANALHHGGSHTIRALQAIAQFGLEGRPLPYALSRWLADSCDAAERQASNKTSLAAKQRAFSNSLGYTSSRGSPRQYEARDLETLQEILSLQDKDGISREKAMNNYINAHPDMFKNSSNEYLKDLFEKYGDIATYLYAQKIALLEINQFPK